MLRDKVLQAAEISPLLLEIEMKYAIVESGGKQYRAVEGGYIDVDLLKVETGDEIKLDQVLLVSDGEAVKVGTPVISGAHVEATVAGPIKARKILVFKYRSGNRYRRRAGHRQGYTRLQIDKIVGS
ncbi:MAG TPA: 50S ribosomal protein L21 [Anaerolineales bacterium]|nr:50S ribosomal protein L21 [Anaerolineales bacterium]